MYRPPANIERNSLRGRFHFVEYSAGGAIFRPADLFRDTGSYFMTTLEFVNV